MPHAGLCRIGRWEGFITRLRVILVGMTRVLGTHDKPMRRFLAVTVVRPGTRY
jgi:hypothetical protein